MNRDKKKIKNLYLSKLKEIKKHNINYYDKNKPIIDDSEYDKLKNQILEIEKNFKFLSSKDSPSKVIGSKPGKNFLKYKHRTKMLSLANAFDQVDLVNFEKKISNFLNLKESKDIEYSVEPKIDGISASLTYKNSNLILGLSRGMVLKESYCRKE